MSTCFLGVSTSKTCRLHRVPHFSLSRLKHAHLPRLFRVASAALPVSKRGAALPASSRGCFAWQVPTSTLAGCALAASAVSRGRRTTSAAPGRNWPRQTSHVASHSWWTTGEHERSSDFWWFVHAHPFLTHPRFTSRVRNQAPRVSVIWP